MGAEFLQSLLTLNLMDPYSAAVNAFGLLLLPELFKEANGNVVMSPLSIHEALMMTTNGAVSDTFTQLASLLQLPGITNSREV